MDAPGPRPDATSPTSSQPHLAPAPGHRHRWRLRRGDVGRALLGVAATAVGLEFASWLLPDVEIGGALDAVVLAVSIGLWSALLRPVMVFLAARTGWPGAVLLAIFGQALIVWLTLYDPAGSRQVTLVGALLASWIVAAVSTTAVWAVTAGSDDAATASLVRRAKRRGTVSVPDPDVTGVVFVQLDGVPYPVLEQGVMSGTLPTLARWVRSGSHRMAEWRPTLPATTPASQMGILHGTTEGIPAFRWVDRASGRVLVANRPADATLIEAAHSNGRGLLADDGVSISNLFTGDAPTAYATMSAIGRTQETVESRSTIARFLSRPDGLARGITRTVSEVFRERFQARRAVRRDLRPRVHRGWGFAMERAFLNGALRDLNTSLVAEAMLVGRHAVYVDYVDYDAVAHHAGIFRPESLSALEGLDAVLAQLETVAGVAPRRYRFVVLSDHGQSQGEVFADRYGEELADVVARLAGVDVATARRNLEGAGRLNTVFASGAGDDTVLGRALDRASNRVTERAYTDDDRVEAATHATPAADSSTAPFVVFGSGNLGLVFVAGESQKVPLDTLTERFPGLVSGLVTHPGVGFVVVTTRQYGPVVLGRGGEHRLTDGVVVGIDPLARFGPHAPEFVARLASMPEAPDILVNSLLDDMGEVAAFEGLVGCHGGLGGWQDRAMLVWPAELPGPDSMVVGADALHRLFVGWLELLHHRRHLAPEPADRSGADVADPT
jgi:uncharacterized membrane protein YvlD (DUF360 family)